MARSGSSEQVIGERERDIMKKHERDMPAGKLQRVKDFLPAPHELAAAEPTVKITITLNKSSVEFFKQEANKNRTKYQKMIREVLDHYVNYYRAV